MRGVGPPSRAWEARVIAVIRHPQDLDRIAPIDRLSQDAEFFYSGKLYESRMKLKSDITTISETQFSAGVERGKSLGLAEGKSLGLAEGKSLGLAEGSRQKAFETAHNLLVMGLSIENIAKATGLTLQEVETLHSC